MISKYKYRFSVVMAVYNVEDYLEEAIDSIISQDIGFQEHVELILVDDGSADRSGQICDTYKAKYPDNIKVIHKENGGASSARNEGIRHTEGRYVNFLDSDDKLSTNTLSAVYDYFSAVDQDVDFVSIPMFFFEKKEQPHRLNYKYAAHNNKTVDLQKEYTYVQMSAPSAFFKREVLTPDFFDTSLRYSEDAKAIMNLLLQRSRYGIVPEGRYYYRFRNTMNSAVNGSKLHREWYLDCLKDYILWSAKAAMDRFGYVPKFVQFTMMYDLQSRFRMEELPEGVLSEDEQKEFMELLKKSLSYIGNQIILEQKNLSKEQKDYIIGMKNDVSAPEYEYGNEDGWMRYGVTVTHPASSYMLKLRELNVQGGKIEVLGSAKLNSKFPYPSEIYLRLSSENGSARIPCVFEPNPERTFRFMGKLLAQFVDFQAVIPRKALTGRTKVEFCMTCDSHPILFRNLAVEKSFPLPAGEKKIVLEDERLILRYCKTSLSLEKISMKEHLTAKYHDFRKKLRSGR